MRELTKGSPAKVIMTFALPIIFGNLLQQLYNLADGKIVSTYVGTQAFAAVGATAVDYWFCEWSDPGIWNSDIQMFWSRRL